jgi:hypothetical protein
MLATKDIHITPRNILKRWLKNLSASERIVTFDPLWATEAPYSFSSKALRKILLARNKRDLVAATEMPASSATSFTERSLD